MSSSQNHSLSFQYQKRSMELAFTNQVISETKHIVISTLEKYIDLEDMSHKYMTELNSPKKSITHSKNLFKCFSILESNTKMTIKIYFKMHVNSFSTHVTEKPSKKISWQKLNTQLNKNSKMKYTTTILLITNNFQMDKFAMNRNKPNAKIHTHPF